MSRGLNGILLLAPSFSLLLFLAWWFLPVLSFLLFLSPGLRFLTETHLSSSTATSPSYLLKVAEEDDSWCVSLKADGQPRGEKCLFLSWN